MLYLASFSFLSNIIPLSTKFDGESTGNMLYGSFSGKGMRWNRSRGIGNGAKSNIEKRIIYIYIP